MPTIHAHLLAGHAPGHLRDAFVETVEQATACCAPLTPRPRSVEAHGPAVELHRHPAPRVLPHLDLPQGSTYAQAARAIRPVVAPVAD
jgi:hypothetical protein